MPSIDLARLRKQAMRLADFFFVPDEFARQLSATLDTYVNYTMRSRRPASPGTILPSHRTPGVILRQIEQELTPIASNPQHADAALALADRLWDEGWLETRLLAAFVLGHIAPEEGPLVARLTAWTGQVRDPELRSRLLDSSLHRMRKEAPDMFLHMLGEWLRPERARLWADGIRAAISAIRDPHFVNVPGLMRAIEPVVRAAPPDLQLELEELITALYAVSPTETAFFLHQAISGLGNPEKLPLFRRMLPSLPDELREDLEDLVRRRPSVDN